MSTLFLIEKHCYHCGTPGTYPNVDPLITTVGPKDLDGRPTHVQRSEVYIWIQKCLSCGYCAQDIASGDPTQKPVIESDRYHSQLRSPDFPETANAFLSHLFLMKKDDLYADAGWDALFAAWICDDNGFEGSARTCRVRAIELFSEASSREQQFAPSLTEGNALLVDLYRRTGQFDKALMLCAQELSNEDLDERQFCILSYQKDLINKSDTLCHSEIDSKESDC